MEYKAENYPFTKSLNENWKQIKKEYEDLTPNSTIPWPEKDLYDKGWDVFGLYHFGKKIQENCNKCPITTKIVEAIPGMSMAGYSILRPGTHIKPHVGYPGYSNTVLRCHLGLIIPEGCKMRVASKMYTWEEGISLVFDDSIEHEVWHNGTTSRIILLIDFKRSL